MKLKRRKVERRSTERLEKRIVVRRTAPGKNVWDCESESLRWTENENAEINNMLMRSGVNYSDFIREIKRLYHHAVPLYEQCCAELAEDPSDEGLQAFVMRGLQKYFERLSDLEAATVH